jgi:hypothetical protein
MTPCFRRISFLERGVRRSFERAKESLPFRVCVGVVYGYIDSLVHGGRHFGGLYVVVVCCLSHTQL